jgi:hypothetical protein
MPPVHDILPPGSNLSVPEKSNWQGDVYRLQQMRGVSYLRPGVPLRLHPDGIGGRTLTRSRCNVHIRKGDDFGSLG